MDLRSAEWYAGDDRNAYIHRAWMRRGNPEDALAGTKPQIAIANTASDLTPCNKHLDEVAESVKAGIWEAGGVPYNLPVVSIGETQVKPTAMLWRNLAAMAMEEMFRANPVDGLVLLGGCDKTIPALLMAAASVDIPAIVVPGGPMLTGHFRGEALGCGTDVWRLSEEARAGTITNGQFIASEQSMIRGKGHCNTMGTASTMAVVAEALGMTIPGFAGTPAADARLLSMSHETGRLIVELVSADRKPSDIMTKQSFLNAIIAVAAVGGSTNSVVHLLAIAGRLGIPLTLDDFDEAGSGVPLLANLQPSGAFLMDDLFRAGGVLALLTQVKHLLHPEPITVTGRPLVDTSRRARNLRRHRHPDSRRCTDGGCRHRRAARKPRAATARSSSLRRRHPNCCSTSARRSCSTRSRTCTPASTTPTSTSPPTPCSCCAAADRAATRGCRRSATCRCRAKLLEAGVRDMVRISDARMSGTAYGTVILHVAPEAAAGGPLGLVRTGDVDRSGCRRPPVGRRRQRRRAAGPPRRPRDA